MPKLKELFVICLVIVLGVVFASYYSFNKQTATVADTVLMVSKTETTTSPTETPTAEDSEQRFDTPIPITWNARVLGCLVSCIGYSFQNIDPKAKYTYFQGYDGLLDERYLDLRDRTFQVRGQWTGIDCAYKNTVFGGQCTPSIDITEMKEFPVNPVDWFSEELVKVASKNYMFVEWRTAGNASENIEFSLWDLVPNSKTYTLKSYSFWADYDFRRDNYDEAPCSGPRYSTGSKAGEIGKFFKDKILQFLKEEGWPKQCLGITSM